MKRRFARKATAVAISDVTAAIASTTFNVMPDGRTTACTLKLDNGFIVTGLAHCSPFVTFNPEIGRAAAEDDAREQLFGYLTFAMLEQTYRDSDQTEPGESLREMAMNASNAWANRHQDIGRAQAAKREHCDEKQRSNAQTEKVHPASAEGQRIQLEALAAAARDGMAAVSGGRVISREEMMQVREKTLAQTEALAESEAFAAVVAATAGQIDMEAQAQQIIADALDKAIVSLSPQLRAILPDKIIFHTGK